MHELYKAWRYLWLTYNENGGCPKKDIKDAIDIIRVCREIIRRERGQVNGLS